MGEPTQPTEGVVVPSPLTFEGERVRDAGNRSTAALARAKASVERITTLKASVTSEPSAPGDVDYPNYIAAVALINHQLGLATKAAARAEMWDNKCQRRVSKFALNGDYESAVKAIRYAHVTQKKAAAAERQAQWAEHYAIDQNRYPLVDDPSDDGIMRDDNDD